MKKIRLNTLHRHVGLSIAPFMMMQGITGALLSVLTSGGTGKVTADTSNGELVDLLINLHFGPGILHQVYLLVLATGAVWMAGSGSALYIRVRRARRLSTVTTMNRKTGASGS